MLLPKRKIKLIFFIHSMSGGGAERVLLNVLKYLDREKFNPLLVLINKRGELIEEIPGDVTIYDMAVRRNSISVNTIPLLIKFYRIIRTENPDVIFSFMWEQNLIACILNFFLRIKIIVSEHASISNTFNDLFHSTSKKKLLYSLVRTLYGQADHILSVSAGLKEELINLGLSSAKISVIHNPVDLTLIEKLKAEPIGSEEPYILFAGRLVKQKNIPLLIGAFNMIKNNINANLVILGDGEEEDNLKRLTIQLNLEGRIIFKKFMTNPYKYMANAEVFVLPSSYEGFGNVLIEAMACGTPVVSTRCPHGPDEIIEDGINGFLVPVDNPQKMGETILRILDDTSLRGKLVARGMQRVKSFDISEIVRKYESLIFRTVNS
jgi:glycosyltransferase involved in cell wall biosynthesis